MIIENFKKALFFMAAFLPLIILIGILLNVSFNVFRINSVINYQNISSEVKSYLSSQRGELSFRRTGDELILEYEYLFPQGETEAFERKIDLSHDKNGYNIFVVGSSPVIARPPWQKRGFKTFSQILEEKLLAAGLDLPIKVFNLGMTSADSLAIKRITEEAVGQLKPDLIIYYYGGGMDYETAYYASRFKQQHYPLTVLPLKKTKASGVWGFIRKYGGWLNRMYIQPYLISFLQRVGLIELQEEDFKAINEIIYRDIEKNVNAVRSFSNKNSIPVIFVTALNNFEARPFGIDAITRMNYEQGMAETDIDKKYAYLVAARDSELFTGDIGAKSRVNDIFRDFSSSEGVYVVDMHNYMLAHRQLAGYDYFYDHAHMRPVLQEKIAERLFDYIGEKEFVPGYSVEVIGRPLWEDK